MLEYRDAGLRVMVRAVPDQQEDSLLFVVQWFHLSVRAEVCIVAPGSLAHDAAQRLKSRTYSMLDRRATKPPRRTAWALLLAIAALTAAGESAAASWEPPPSRRAADPAFRFHPSPEDWRDVSIYQVLTDRFADGDPGNNLANAEGVFNPYGPDSLHGGDFAGLLANLDYIQGLGMKAIWISPVCLNEKGRYHGYAAWDFNRVDPHWGTLEELRTLIDAAHARGIYVLLDIVFNHMAGMVRSTDPEWPRFRDDEYELEWRWPDHTPPAPFDRLSRFHGHGDIADWKDPRQVLVGSFSGLADIRTTDPEVRRDLVRIYAGWIEATDCDGFRVDSVRHTEGDFFDEVLPALRAHAAALGKERFLIAGEVWSSRQELTVPYTGTNRFHSLLDFPLRRVLQRVFFENEPMCVLPSHVAGLAAYPEVARERLVSFLDNHDNPRLLHAPGLAQPLDRMAAALAYQFLHGQVPCLYYGTEQGFDGGNDPANREDFFDGEFEQGPSVGDNFDPTHPLYRWVRRLNLLREIYPELGRGRHQSMACAEDGPGIYAFARVLGNDAALVAVNNSPDAATAQVDLSGSPLAAEGSLQNVLTGGEHVPVRDGTALVRLPGWGSAVLVAPQRVQPVPPSLVAVTPEHDAQADEPLREVRLTFDQPMDRNGASAHVRIEPALRTGAEWNEAGTELRLVMSATPPAGAYRVSVDGAWAAVSGRPLSATVSTRFRVGHAAAVAGPLGPFVMDGRLDPGAIEVPMPDGIVLHAAYDAATGAFYVAGPPAANGYDHFILVADKLLEAAIEPAPWGKAGEVAARGPFLADENDNEFHAWRKVNGRASSATGERVEGVLNLVDHFGRKPEMVYLGFASYETGEKGRLGPRPGSAADDLAQGDVAPDAFVRLELRADGRIVVPKARPPATPPGAGE